MSWRTVVIASRCKLDMSLGYMEIRRDDVVKIHLSEIAVLIVESTAVSLTAALLAELTKRKVKVIFCDERRNPHAELIPCCGSYDASGKLRRQIAWPQSRKELLWAAIIREKIRKQQAVLHYAHESRRAQMLEQYAEHVEEADARAMRRRYTSAGFLAWDLRATTIAPSIRRSISATPSCSRRLTGKLSPTDM